MTIVKRRSDPVSYFGGSVDFWLTPLVYRRPGWEAQWWPLWVLLAGPTLAIDRMLRQAHVTFSGY